MNCYFLFPMIAIAAIACFTDASAQESKQQTPERENVAPWPSPILQIYGFEQKQNDFAKAAMLPMTSPRALRFRCGRYWVDNYSRLIAPDDQKIGIWGIDIPATNFVPMRR